MAPGNTPWGLSHALEVLMNLDVILPAASFCQAVSWWLWCRVKPRRRNCWLPWNC